MDELDRLYEERHNINQSLDNFSDDEENREELYEQLAYIQYEIERFEELKKREI